MDTQPWTLTIGGPSNNRSHKDILVSLAAIGEFSERYVILEGTHDITCKAPRGGQRTCPQETAFIR